MCMQEPTKPVRVHALKSVFSCWLWTIHSLDRSSPSPKQLGLHSTDQSQSHFHWAGAHICTFMFMHGARWWPPTTLWAAKPRFLHACNDNLQACLVTGKVEAGDKSLTYAGFGTLRETALIHSIPPFFPFCYWSSSLEAHFGQSCIKHIYIGWKNSMHFAWLIVGHVTVSTVLPVSVSGGFQHCYAPLGDYLQVQSPK